VVFETRRRFVKIAGGAAAGAAFASGNEAPRISLGSARLQQMYDAALAANVQQADRFPRSVVFEGATYLGGVARVRAA
jgi:hypothetical protein